jgi:hypothetical protein
MSLKRRISHRESVLTVMAQGLHVHGIVCCSAFFCRLPELLHVAEQRHSLYSLAQAHFISQDSVDAIVFERYHPIETL